MPASSTVEPSVRTSMRAHRTPTVVFVILDGLPVRRVDELSMPIVHRLRGDCRLAAPAMSVLTSATYPNHATFATGVDPSAHGVTANRVAGPSGECDAWAIDRAFPTIFDACSRQGRRSVAIFGDQHLFSVMGAAATDHHWPPAGVHPHGTRLDALGYAMDDAPLAFALAALGERPDLLVLQLNSPASAGALHGPDSAEAAESNRAADQAVGQIVAALGGIWHDAVLIVVSDHDQITIENPYPIDLQPALDRIAGVTGDQPRVVIEGDAAIVSVPADHSGPSVFDDLPGIEGRLRMSAIEHLVWAPRGRVLSLGSGEPTALRSVHGGPYTRSQLAIIAGGHAAVPALRHALGRRPVRAADWAPTIACLLDITLPTATGFSFIERSAVPVQHASAPRVLGLGTAW